MSGLFLWSSTESPSPQETLLRMGDSLRHRPYHHTSVCAVHPQLGVGIHTLAQPLPGRSVAASADGRVRVWFVGMLFGHEEPHLDTTRDSAEAASIVLDRYLCRGTDSLEHLDGEFIVAIWDGRRGELVVANDRFGLYPHYYFAGPRGVALAPELKALCRTPGFSARLDPVAISEFIRYQQLLGERTWFEDVSLLPPASILRIRPDGSTVATRYWDWDHFDDTSAISFEDAVEQCITTLQRAVDIRVARAPRAGVLLSGGLDSRTLLGFADGRVPITTLTYGAPDCRDVQLAARLAREAASDHHWFPLTDGRWVAEHSQLHLALTEGLHGWHHAHGITLLEPARRLVNLCLSGWDGGTILGGSLNFYQDACYRYPASEQDLLESFHEGFRDHFTWPGLTDAEAAPLLDTQVGRPLRPLARESLTTALAATRHFPPALRADGFYVNQVLRRSLQLQIVLARSSVEVSCPFFDYRLTEFLYSLPEPIRTNPAFRKEVLTRRQPDLAAVPYDRTLQIPHTGRRYRAQELAHRAKSFVHRRVAPIFPDPPLLYADYEEYLRTDLRDWAEDLLLAPRTLVSELVDPRRVTELWQRHLSGRELWTIGKVAPLMTLELLLRELPAWGAEPSLTP